MKRIFVALLVFVGVVTAHVQGVYDATKPTIAYRNANSAVSDSQFSTSGPCGGQQTFGRNGIAQVGDGTVTTLALRYNGGHASAANAFRLTMNCFPTMPTTDASLRGDGQNIVTGCNGGLQGGAQTNSCPILLNSLTTTPQSSVFTLSFTWGTTTPTAAPVTIPDKSYCVVSMIDQNQWGTCVDFQYNSVAPAPPSGGNTNLNTVVDLSGTYVAADTGATCDISQDGAKCCCMHGSLSLVHNLAEGANYNTASLTGTLYFATNQTNFCTPQNFTSSMNVAMNWPLQPKANLASVLSGTQIVAGPGDTLQATATSGTVSLLNVAAPGSPRVCSNTFYTSSSISNYFREASSEITTSNSTAAAILIPLVILGVVAALFFLRSPIQSCLANSSGTSAKFMWLGFGLNFIVLVLVLATCASDHWSKTSGLHVGPWKTCVDGGSCENTIDALSEGLGSVQATRFFILTAVFPAFALLALPLLAKFGYLGETKAATASFWSLVYVGVAGFICMCVWAAFQYDVLAKYSAFGSWAPDWALGLTVLIWVFAFSTSVVVYVWKLKSAGGSDLQQTKAKSVSSPPPRTTAPPAQAPPQASYPVPQPLGGYEQQQQYGQQQYGQPGVDV